MSRLLGSALVAAVLLLLSPGGGSASSAGTRIVVGYTEQGYAGAPALERELDAQVIGKIAPLHADVLSLGGGEPGGVLALVRADPRVRFAELDGIVHALRVPNDEFLPTQWSVKKTHAEQAWDVSTGSSEVVIGILDTGIDPGQPDLQGKLVAGYDYVNNDRDPNDDNGHGTAVAGIVAADSDNGIGVAGYCWACRLMPVKVLGADGTGRQRDRGARVLARAGSDARAGRAGDRDERSPDSGRRERAGRRLRGPAHPGSGGESDGNSVLRPEPAARRKRDSRGRDTHEGRRRQAQAWKDRGRRPGGRRGRSAGDGEAPRQRTSDPAQAAGGRALGGLCAGPRPRYSARFSQRSYLSPRRQ